MKPSIEICVIALAFGLATPGAARAVSTCGTTCASNCTLTADLECTDGQTGVTLGAGVFLDMAGHTIRCADGNVCATAVKMQTGTGSPLVANGTIRGTWDYGVDCGGNPQRGEAAVMTLRGFFAHTAVSGCAIVEQVIIAATPLVVSDGVSGFMNIYTPICIFQTGTTFSGQLVDKSYVDGCYRPIVRSAAGGAGITLTIKNTTIGLHVLENDMSAGNAITLGSSTSRPAVLDSNVIVGDSTKALIADFNQSVTFTNNVCRRGLTQCGGCVTSGKCVANGTVTSP